MSYNSRDEYQNTGNSHIKIKVLAREGYYDVFALQRIWLFRNWYSKVQYVELLLLKSNSYFY